MNDVELNNMNTYHSLSFFCSKTDSKNIVFGDVLKILN